MMISAHVDLIVSHIISRSYALYGYRMHLIVFVYLNAQFTRSKEMKDAVVYT